MVEPVDVFDLKDDKGKDLPEVVVKKTAFILDRKIKPDGYDSYGEFIHAEEGRLCDGEGKDKNDLIKLYKWIVSYVEFQMMNYYCMVRREFPEDKHLLKEYWNTPRCPIYFSYEFCREDPKLNNGKKAVILIQGKTSSKVGTWSRESCVKKNLRIGTMFPYIDACRWQQWGVMVMNPNANKDPDSGLEIVNSETPEKHIYHVWKNYIVNSGFKDIYIVT